MENKLNSSKKKYLRAPKAKPGELKVAWGKEKGDDPELFFCWGQGTSKRDNNLLMHFFSQKMTPEGKSISQELQERGYDISTLKFSISKDIAQLVNNESEKTKENT